MPENHVKEIRVKLGLSQVQLSRETKIAAPNISAIENGKLKPWDRAKRALARALKTTYDELFPQKPGKSKRYKNKTRIQELLLRLQISGITVLFL
jgi:transcriptional regulator with XRE-family HTH domain